jgi:hypothetical protein
LTLIFGIHWKDVKKIESKGGEEKQMSLRPAIFLAGKSYKSQDLFSPEMRFLGFPM